MGRGFGVGRVCVVETSIFVRFVSHMVEKKGEEEGEVLVGLFVSWEVLGGGGYSRLYTQPRVKNLNPCEFSLNLLLCILGDVVSLIGHGWWMLITCSCF